MADILTVTKRETTGTNSVKKLRENNQTPGVFYEPGKETVLLSIPTRQLERIVNRGNRDVELQGDLAMQATIKDIQWDPFGSSVLHVDLMPAK